MSEEEIYSLKTKWNFYSLFVSKKIRLLFERQVAKDLLLFANNLHAQAVQLAWVSANSNRKVSLLQVRYCYEGSWWSRDISLTWLHETKHGPF